MTRETQLQIEGRAYLTQARDLCRNAVQACNPKHALDDIAEARAALHEAAMRFAEWKRLEDITYQEIPF